MALHKKNDIYFVTGVAGAGRATVLHALEDSHCHVVDNLPLPLMDYLIQSDYANDRPLVVGMDSRSQGFSSHALLDIVHNLQDHPSYNAKIIFMECQDEVLLRRFNSTRRAHPLTSADTSVKDAIKRERALLSDLKEQADLVIDTSAMKPADLQGVVHQYFNIDTTGAMTINILSFAYKHGLPKDADYVFDMRFLDNPFYKEHLKKQTGQDQEVKDFIEKDSCLSAFLTSISTLFNTVIPRYQRDGKKFLTIAFGCTGGQHRSVFAAEYFHKKLSDDGGRVLLRHREIPIDQQ